MDTGNLFGKNLQLKMHLLILDLKLFRSQVTGNNSIGREFQSLTRVASRLKMKAFKRYGHRPKNVSKNEEDKIKFLLFNFSSK